MNYSPVEISAILCIVGGYSAAMIAFGRWLTLGSIEIEEIEDDAMEPESMGSEYKNRSRWVEVNGTMRPVISRIHVIPVEDPDEESGLTHLHCATMECWCTPTFADCTDEEESQDIIVNHNAITSASRGWVTIGERI